ncbi:MAG TPA: DUF1573 domain-containing protein [Sedimentisphaerales bacterium]|nr:DUF1573 domain-containing protein [Sedimentisphaerales bacterium]
MHGNMKTAIRWLTTFLLIFGSAFGIACWLSMSPRVPTQKLDPSNPKHRNMLCGPTSLFNALGRIGVNCHFRDLASQCEISSKGVTLRELERVANGVKEAKSRVKRLNWDGLKRLDGAAVLFVNDDHFIAADPRETPPSSSAKGAAVRIYDEARPAQWMTREQLEEIWTGETLAIERRGPSLRQDTGPRIEWEDCFIDNGVLKPNSISQYAFSFRNVGSADLTIDSVKKSCGCATYTLTSERLARGQAGVIEVQVDLEGKEGYLLNHLAVKTNDPVNPLSILRMAAGVRKARVLSAERISLGDLPQGGKVTREFYATDPGFDGLRIRDVSFLPTTGLDISKHLTCSITYDLLGDDIQRVAKLSGYLGKPEDYVIRLALEASEKCPVGPFQGEVSVLAVADDVISTHKVIIKGAVVQDIHPVPAVVLIALDGEGAGSATIQLRSYAKHDFQIVDAWVDSGTSVKIDRADRPQAPGPKFVLSTLMPAVVAAATPIESAAFFKLHNGTVIRVPITIFKPPQ